MESINGKRHIIFTLESFQIGEQRIARNTFILNNCNMLSCTKVIVAGI